MHIRYVYINKNVQNVKMCRFWMWHLGASFLFPFKWGVCACVAGNEFWVLQQNGALNPHAETTQHQGWVVSKIIYFHPDPAVDGNQKSGEKEPPGMLLKPCTSWEKLPFPQLVIAGFLNPQQYLGKRSNLTTVIFFRWVGQRPTRRVSIWRQRVNGGLPSNQHQPP